MVIDYPEYWWDVQVRYGETGADGHARLSAVADWFQEAAGLNAAELGFGDEVMFRQGVTWVLTRMILRIEKLPLAGEHMRVHTWPARLDHVGHRGYELFDAQGNRLIEATGAWVVMDLQTRRLVPMPEILQSAYPKKTLDIMPFSCRMIPRLRNTERETSILVRRDDLDMNGHVNNARYLGWLLEPLPVDEGTPALLDVQFRAETFPGESLRSICSAAEPLEEKDAGNTKERVHVIARTDSEGRSVDVCRAITRKAS